jgi:hypothetical protein
MARGFVAMLSLSDCVFPLASRLKPPAWFLTVPKQGKQSVGRTFPYRAGLPLGNGIRPMQSALAHQAQSIEVSSVGTSKPFQEARESAVVRAVSRARAGKELVVHRLVRGESRMASIVWGSCLASRTA